MSLKPELQWLLDRAVTQGVIIPLLLPDQLDQHAQWNVPCPNWKTSDVLAAIAELRDMGYIRFFRNDPQLDVRISETDPDLNTRQLIADYRRHQWLGFQLTLDGGTAWELTARPDWERSHIAVFTRGDELGQSKEYLEVVAGSRATLQHAIYYIGCDQSLVPVVGTEVYKHSLTWMPTHWKTLANGSALTVQFCRLSEEYSLSSMLDAEALRMFYDYGSVLADWYVRSNHHSWT